MAAAAASQATALELEVSATCVILAEVDAVTAFGKVAFWFSSIDIAGVVPTVEPKPITKSSAESSKPT